MSKESPIIVALDMPNLSEAVALSERLNPAFCRLKVGKELFSASGPQGVEALQKLGFEIFLDLKFHDIPTTVAKALSVVQSLGVWMTNVHASGGEHMLKASREAVDPDRMRLIGVTVLTSMNDQSLPQIGVHRPLQAHVMALAALAQACELDGVVCSAHEATALKQQFGKTFELITPGVRLSSVDNDDQQRTMTPVDAMDAGSDYLVIGRPITRAKNPLIALELIVQSLL